MHTKKINNSLLSSTKIHINEMRNPTPENHNEYEYYVCDTDRNVQWFDE